MQDLLRWTKADLLEVAQDKPDASLVDQLFLLIAGRVRAKKLRPGAKLPSVRQLADDCDVSRDTAARAYERLVAHGLVESRRGSGYYVKSAGSSTSLFRDRPTWSGPASSGPTRWRTLMVKPDASLKTRCGSGLFPESWLDEATLRGAVTAVARQSVRALAHHSDLRGYLPLRQQLQVKLQELGILADVDNILVTHGATEAIHLVAQGFLRVERVPVMVERPGPPLLTDRLLSTGMEIYPVPRLQDGPDLGVMRTLCEKYHPRVFFCSSVLQNPTCTQIAPHKAFQLLQMAEELDLTIVEDDTYGDLMPGLASAPFSRLATLDQFKRVIYIGSFSKTVAPGLRCGFLAASPEKVDWLMSYRVLDSISAAGLSERVLHHVLSSGNYRKHCDRLRNRLAESRSLVLADLERWGLTVDPVPEAGMFLWASLGRGVESMEVAEGMLAQGHLLAPGLVFSDGREVSSFMRINIAQAVGSSMLPALGKLIGRRG